MFCFCLECSNMFYFKEDEVDCKFMFICCICNFFEEVILLCIFCNVFNNVVGEMVGVMQDVGFDFMVGDFFVVFYYVSLFE